MMISARKNFSEFERGREGMASWVSILGTRWGPITFTSSLCPLPLHPPPPRLSCRYCSKPLNKPIAAFLGVIKLIVFRYLSYFCSPSTWIFVVRFLCLFVTLCRLHLRKIWEAYQRWIQNYSRRHPGLVGNRKEMYFTNDWEAQLKCGSANVIYCITCTLSRKIYIGETGRLSDRFRELLRDFERNDKDASKPFARHFNLPDCCSQHVICGLVLHQGNTEGR